MKLKLSLLPLNGGAFSCLPAREIELDAERILCNDVHFPWEHFPRNPSPKLYVISNEFGAMGAVWADHEQDALDELVDSGLGNGLLIDEQDADEESPRLGNAGEPCNLDYCTLQIVRFDKTLDFDLIIRFAEARGANQTTLDN